MIFEYILRLNAYIIDISIIHDDKKYTGIVNNYNYTEKIIKNIKYLFDNNKYIIDNEYIRFNNSPINIYYKIINDRLILDIYNDKIWIYNIILTI